MTTIRQEPSSRFKSLLIFLILALAGIFLLGDLVLILVPIPGIFLILLDRRWMWGLWAVAILATVLLGSGVPYATPLILLQIYTIVTVIIFIGFSAGWSSQKIILRTTVTALAICILSSGFLMVRSQQGDLRHPFHVVESAITSWVENLEKGLQDLRDKRGISKIEDQLRWLHNNREEIIQTAVRIMPSVVAGMLFLTVFLDFFIAQFFWSHAGGLLPSHSSMEEWHVHDLLSWAVVLALGLIFFKASHFRAAAWNVLILMAAIYLTQGIGVLLFFIHRSRMGLVGKIIVLVLAFLIAYFYPLLILIGFFDTWIDLRKVRPRAAT